MRLVVKVGSSSITSGTGEIKHDMLERLVAQVQRWRDSGHEVLVVSSGAISAGVAAVGLTERPTEAVKLQALSAVGQSRLMRTYDDAFAASGLVSGQVLLSPGDFFERKQYLHARATLESLLAMRVVPIINENDAVADDAIRFGDNDRIAALVAQLIGADVLVLLTDTEGLLTGDPRTDASASLISEVLEIDRELEDLAGGAGSARGSGGMASKLSAAKMATWAGVRTVIAAADKVEHLDASLAGEPGTGTVVQPRPRQLGARKLWIAFAVRSEGQVVVDAGAVDALRDGSRSLLAVGVTGVEGTFPAGAAVEVAGPDGEVFAKGLVRYSAEAIASAAGRRSQENGTPASSEVINRDELVVLP